MNKEAKDQEVLMAILNVKKYAKNLRKKASNLQEPSDGPDIDLAGSSPSFIDNHQHDYMELNSPLLATKSSYNESFESNTRKKKQHSMAYLPGPRKVDRQSRKNSNCLIPQPLSPAKTYTHALGRTNLSHSYKMEDTGIKSKQSVWKKQLKQPTTKYVSFERKGSEDKSELNSIANFQQFNQTMPVISTGEASKNNKQRNQCRILNAEAVQELIKEVCRLKNQINEYKKSLVLVRGKYLEMERKCRQKIQIDHLLDQYRQRIIQLESQREILYQTIKKQNQKIANFQSTVIQVAKKFSTYYTQQTHKLKLFAIQNEIYKELLHMKTPQNGSATLKVVQDNNKKVHQPVQPLSISSESESQEIEQPSRVWGSNSICKNEREIKAKYDLIQNFME